MTVVPLRALKSHEEKDELRKWWGLMKCQMKGTQFKDVMYKTWEPDEENRGFKEYKVGEKTITAEEQSSQVEDMLESIASFVPDIAASAIIPKAKSLNWVYEFL